MKTKVTQIEVGKMGNQADRWKETKSWENRRYYEANHKDILQLYSEFGWGRCNAVWGISKTDMDRLIKKYGKEYGIDENSKVAYDRIALYPDAISLGSTIINGFVSVLSSKNNLISWLEGICQRNEEIINNQGQLIDLLKLKLATMEKKDACLREILGKHTQLQLAKLAKILKNEGAFI